MFLAQCSQGCTHGSCTSPNVCTCSAGWTGTSCATGNITLAQQQKYEILTCVFQISYGCWALEWFLYRDVEISLSLCRYMLAFLIVQNYYV